MHLVRFSRREGDRAEVGLLDGAGVRAITAAGSLSALMREPLDRLREICAQTGGPAVPVEEVGLLPPVDGLMEVWAAGVTYARSMEARVEESSQASVYELVRAAARPELFYKAAPWQVVTGGERIAVRGDSALDVPEPELAAIVNCHGEIAGYTVCNDVSSRAIEGENPLYLPQAKVYAGSCALAAAIRPAWEVPDPYDLPIAMAIHRSGQSVWTGSTSTSLLERRICDLVDWLFAEQHFPDGVVLSTGTCLVPGLDVTLQRGDAVSIDIGGVGSLHNPVVEGKDAMAWLVPPRAALPGGRSHDGRLRLGGGGPTEE
ncbi:MAG: 2-dehydro-3-deoxy-D-arabinonate dehydratase [Actinomycetota bacterium]|nr:2-dehydro-3-deoxy-D-arabinonate dehydratase [Actinomycetota bacterium]